ncbi:MAG: EutP/PduV family microcompartment system protein [Clostridium sp.]
MKKVIFMGKSGCGKTSLCQKLQGEEIKYKKTQSIELFTDSIDTPGEYMENRGYYSALIITSTEAEVIAVVQECGDIDSKIPPAFAGTFGKKVIGIITKIDTVNEGSNIDIIENQLRCVGVTNIFKVSVITGEGMEELQKFLIENVKK